MTREQINKLATFYADKFDGPFTQKHSLYDRCNSDLSVPHIAWMCREIPRLEADKKADRWLGFVQGVLWRNRDFTIDELRQHVIEVKK